MNIGYHSKSGKMNTTCCCYGMFMPMNIAAFSMHNKT